MAILFDGPVTPVDATTLVRSVPTPQNLTLNQILPDRTTAAMEVDFNVVTRIGNTARFRAHDAPAHITKRDSMVLNRAPLVPLSGAKPVIGELEQARLYGLRRGSESLGAVADAIYDDMVALTLDVRRRAEQARGAALSTGTFVINEGGMNGTIDYGVPSGNKITASTLWSTVSSADIITFLNTVRQTYINLNGYAPGGLLTSTPVLNYIQQNALLRSMAVQTIGPSLQGYAGLLPPAAVNAILGTFNLPSIQVYDTRVSTDGSTTGSLVLPANVVIVLPPADVELGYMAWGPTVTAQKLAEEGVLDLGDVPGLVGFVDKGDDFPYKEQSFVDSLTLPVITNPNAMMVLTVA